MTCLQMVKSRAVKDLFMSRDEQVLAIDGHAFLSQLGLQENAGTMVKSSAPRSFAFHG